MQIHVVRFSFQVTVVAIRLYMGRGANPRKGSKSARRFEPLWATYPLGIADFDRGKHDVLYIVGKVNEYRFREKCE